MDEEYNNNKIETKAVRPSYAGRSASASPATGLAAQHKHQQEKLSPKAKSKGLHLIRIEET